VNICAADVRRDPVPLGAVAVGVAVFAGFSGAKSRTSLGRTVVALLAVATGVAVLPGAAASARSRHLERITTEFVCPRYPVVGQATCLAERRTDVPVRRQAEINATAAPTGFAPADLKSAYNIPAAPVNTTTIPTVAIVDAYDDPDVVSDVATYRSTFGLQSCVTSTGSGCVTKVNQSGGTSVPSANSGWASEIALDLEMVSAACPVCKILLVEASSSSNANLAAAAKYAASRPGVVAVSNSYGGSESSSETGLDGSYKPPAGVAMLASSGDEGYESQSNRGNPAYQIEYPAASQYVIAVGGTSLRKASGTARGWTESVWWTSDSEAATSGCSLYEAKPSWQHDSGCKMRTVADVSAVADPATGVAVLDTYGSGGWTELGGTSVASPLVATLYAMSGTSTPSAQSLYPATAGGPTVLGLNDVTSGDNYSKCPTTNAYLCTAEVGYDGPTGNGTPWGLAAFGAPASTSTGAPFTISANPSAVTVAPGSASTAIAINTAMVSGNNPEALTLNVSALPSGVTTSPAAPITVPAAATASTSLTLNLASTTAYGSYPITVTATDGSNNTASTTITLTVPNPCNNAQQLANPGFESGNTGWTSTPNVIGEWTGGEAPHSGSWDAWMDGYTSKHTDSLSQTIAVPGASCKTATLTFWVKMITTQTRTATDTFTANLGGQTLVLNNTSPVTAWTQEKVTYSLTTGQTSVPVTLTGVQAGSATTSFIVDDTSLTFS
jgi:hypothetical protein